MSPVWNVGIINADGYNLREEFMADIGYSGTPLVKKLGFKPPLIVLIANAPKEYRAWLGELPEGVTLTARAKPPIQAAHVFATGSACRRKKNPCELCVLCGKSKRLGLSRTDVFYNGSKRAVK
jgi:hypothetical protein